MQLIPMSNPLFEWLITEYVRAVYVCDAHINKLVCFSPVKLCFVSLICRVPANETKMGRGKRKISLPYSTNPQAWPQTLQSPTSIVFSH